MTAKRLQEDTDIPGMKTSGQVLVNTKLAFTTYTKAYILILPN